MDWPYNDAFLGAGSVISTSGPESIGGIAMPGTSSAAWSSANRALYVPFRLDEPRKITKLGIVNGATASGNFDIGIMGPTFAKLTSTGSTAQAGTLAAQVVDVTDTVIGPGLYYFALAMNGTTGTAIGFGFAAAWGPQVVGVLMEASAFPLPTTGTPVRCTATNVPYIFGSVRGSVL